MSGVNDLKTRFDSEGRYRDQDGSIPVVFATKGGGRFAGTLDFRDGVCVRAAMQGGQAWVHSDSVPIDGLQFLLDLGTVSPYAIALDKGCVVFRDEPSRTSSKRDFLLDLRVARNLFVHPRKVEADSSTVDSDAVAALLTRAAIWLTPKSVAGFQEADFPELGLTRQAELLSAVQRFRAIADQVPADKPATREQFEGASDAFATILQILGPYLPVPDEAREVEAALRNVEYPPWKVNWDYAFASDSDGVAAVWVTVFVDENAVPLDRLGSSASELTAKIRQAFDNRQIQRWPYLRLRTAQEHKVG